MGRTSYSEFSRSLHERYAGKRVPLEVSLEITRRCPLACKHCYNNLNLGDFGAGQKELRTEEYFKLLDDIADLGCLWLLFTGGELFVRKDFLDIYKYAKSKGFLITLFSNGILIDEKIADFLLEYPPFAVEISIYGRTKQTYEALTGVPGSYERCLRGIELLRQRGLPVRLKTVVTSINKGEVAEMSDFSKQELGLDFKFDSLINARLDCSQAPLTLRLTPEEVVALDVRFPEMLAEYRRLLQRDFEGATVPDCGTVYGCGGGMQSFAIDPYGQMSICGLSTRQTYSIRSGSVKEGWARFLAEVRNVKRKKHSKCITCRLRSLCGMCPAYGELENGDAERPVEFLCEVAHLRAMVLGFEVPAHGECEFCADGLRHREIGDKVRTISREFSGNTMLNNDGLITIRASIMEGDCRRKES